MQPARGVERRVSRQGGGHAFCGLVSGLVVLRVRVKQRPERTSDRASADAMLVVVGERINGAALLQGFNPRVCTRQKDGTWNRF